MVGRRKGGRAEEVGFEEGLQRGEGPEPLVRRGGAV